MKKKLFFLLIIPSLIIVSCKKDKENNPLGAGYPEALNNLVTPAIIDSLQLLGLTINSGLTPPIINGAYYLNPNVCTYDSAGGGAKGQTFGSYIFNFSNQNNNNSSIAFQYGSKKDNSSTGSNASFITGTGNSFTIFSQVTSNENNVPVTELVITSGILDGNKIRQLKYALRVMSKTDPLNSVIPVNAVRIFTDEDGESEKVIDSLNTAQHAEQGTFSLLQMKFR